MICVFSSLFGFVLCDGWYPSLDSSGRLSKRILYASYFLSMASLTSSFKTFNPCLLILILTQALVCHIYVYHLAKDYLRLTANERLELQLSSYSMNRHIAIFNLIFGPHTSNKPFLCNFSLIFLLQLFSLNIHYSETCAQLIDVYKRQDSYCMRKAEARDVRWLLT